jgi:hypothetical protein
MAAAWGPLRRTMPMPPRPGGVEMAAIVSVAMGLDEFGMRSGSAMRMVPL